MLQHADMTFENLVRRHVATVDSPATIVPKEMCDRHVSPLVVTEADGAALKPVGIVTDRDRVVNILALDLAPGRVTEYAGSVFGQHRWSTAPAICGASFRWMIILNTWRTTFGRFLSSSLESGERKKSPGSLCHNESLTRTGEF